MDWNWGQNLFGGGMFRRLYGFGQRMKRMFEGFLLFLLACPVVLFYVLVFAGCVSESPGLPGLYLVSVKNTNATKDPTANLTVRIGYFGMCSYYSDTLITCSPSNGRSGDTLAPWLVQTNDLNAIWFLDFAATIQRELLFYLLAFAGPLFMVALVFFLLCIFELNTRDPSNPDPVPARNRRMIAMMAGGTMWSCVALNIAAATGTLQAANALQFFSGMHDGGVFIQKGSSVQALQWLIVCFTFIIALGVSTVCRDAYQVPIFVDGGNQGPAVVAAPMMQQPMMDGGYGVGYGGGYGGVPGGGYGGYGGQGMFGGGFNPWGRMNQWRQNWW